ncbi:Desert hedgehog protein B [Gracilariopsis chorda]|uniref:Desert hedgehog protein B n=1 Tax=Gracilariopsis chorda TaxID=448386 RepID=A0A2V3IXZ1_9FLOR|nr:Desert hedgehog protein B [Gracilariopsis chorda]|eukprot:PXF46933.1 Desert hedgehog protein B [Gracilariopsis chorda]
MKLLGRKHGVQFTLVFLVVLFHVVKGADFSMATILQDYQLAAGRPSACPLTVSYEKVSGENRVIPAGSMKVEGVKCTGPGGKRVEPGTDILRMGLSLPSHVSHKDVFFFAGVESAPRVCGPWAFNASAISWFFTNMHDTTVKDEELGIKIHPGYIYVTYSHFSDFCMYQKKLHVPLELSNKQEQDQKEAYEEKEKNDHQGDKNTGSCFPNDAFVSTEDGRIVSMKELQVGDRVLSSPDGTYSDIFMFTHKDESVAATFVKISTRSGKTLLLSEGHYLFVDDKTKTAAAAVVGDTVTLASGTKDRIVDIQIVLAKGLHNPQTLDGNIVVNGILATTWTSAAPPVTASLLLTPVRGMYKLLPTSLFASVRSMVEIIVDSARPFVTTLKSRV